MKIWLLTSEINDYNQCGEYFEAAYKDKPTHHQLTEAGVETKSLRHVLNGGGRTPKYEDHWYHLKEVELK